MLRRPSSRTRGRVEYGSVLTPAQLIPDMKAFWDPAKGVGLSGSDVLTVDDQAPGGTADTLASIAAERPTYVADDGGYPAFNFSGTLQRFEVPDSADLSPTTALSLSIWVKQDVVGVTRAFFAKWVSPTFPWALYASVGNDLLFEINGGTQVGTYNIGAGTGWKHIVVIYNGAGAVNADRLKMYEGGMEKVLGFAGTIPASLPDDAQALSVGAFVGGGSALTGRMGHIGVVHRVITAAEIAILGAYQPR